MIRQFLFDEDGVTAVEYAVMVALVILGILVAVVSMSDSLINHFNDVETTVDGL